MGLLDALLQNDGGSGGGLLDFLRANGMNQQASPGLSSDQAQYGQPIFPQGMPPQNAQPSPLDAAQWPSGPLGAPAQANAQMPPQQPPPVQGAPVQPPQGGPGVGPGLMAGAQGVGNHLMAGLQSFAQSGGVIPGIANGLAGLITGQRSDPAGVAAQQLAEKKNYTVDALRKRGVSDADIGAALSNSDYMKKILDNSVKEKDTPTGFEANPTGGLRPITGGPADPAYLRLKAIKEQDPNAVHVLGKDGELYKVDEKGNPTIVHKNETKIDASLDEDTTRLMANQYLSGDKSVLQNLGRGAQGSANLIKLRTAIKTEADKQGLDGSGISQRMIDYAGDTARERSAATMEGRMAPAAIEAKGAFKIAREASDALSRTNFVPYNKILQAGQSAMSNPELKAAATAYNTAVMTYSRAVSPTGVGSVTAQEHARQILETADGPRATKAAFDQLDREVDMAHASPTAARAGFAAERAARGTSASQHQSQGASGDAIYEQARAAIAKGAPREKVLERLRQNGVDASGL